MSKKLSVADANVWLAILSRQHTHHQRARRWADGLGAGEAGLCRLAQLTVLRLMGMKAVAGEGAVPIAQAWIGIEQLLEDERIEFVEEPPGLAAIWPTLFRYGQPTPNLVNDSYLAAFAIAGGHKVVTFDRGFAEFRGLEVQILD